MPVASSLQRKPSSLASEAYLLDRLLEAYQRIRSVGSDKLRHLKAKPEDSEHLAIASCLERLSFHYSSGSSAKWSSLTEDLLLVDVSLLFLTRCLLGRLLSELSNANVMELVLERRNDEILASIDSELRETVASEMADLGSQYCSDVEAIVFFGNAGRVDIGLEPAVQTVQTVPIDAVDEGLLGDLYQGCLDADKRKLAGEYYTPVSVVDYLLDQALGSVGSSAKALLDPACGIGSFLVRAQRRLDGTGSECVGFDLNPFSIALTRFQSVWATLREKKESSRSVLFVANSLEKSGLIPEGDNALALYRDQKKYDCVVGNPPYIRAERLKSGSLMKSLWGDAWGPNSDTAILFLLRSLTEWLKDKGKLCVVVSGGIANSEASRPLRLMLASEVTVTHMLWLEMVPRLWDANIIPMLLVVERRPPQKGDIIKVSVPTRWPQSDLDYSAFRYEEYFSEQVNPEKYLLPFIQSEDVLVLRRLSRLPRVGDSIRFTYGVQRGRGAKLESEPCGSKPIRVIDGKSMSMCTHGSPVGWVDLERVQKRSLWAEWCASQRPYLAVPVITMAPTAVYIDEPCLAALDTAVVAAHQDPTFLKALAAYLNSSVARFTCLLQGRAGVMSGSHRLHMYPRTVEHLPWINDEAHGVQDLAAAYDRLHHILGASVSLDGEVASALHDVDMIVTSRMGLSEVDLQYVLNRLASPPLSGLTPRLPWTCVDKRLPMGYVMDRYQVSPRDRGAEL